MAAIGKIRSWGPVLVTVIGLALFAFIAEELFRSCDSLKNQERQRVGEVLGKKIDVQEYQNLVDEYTDVIKMTQGRDNLTDAEANQVKDMVWNQFIQNTVFEAEAKKLGLTVTDEEMQNLLQEGTNPMLLQTPFVNQQTGRFDANSLKQFLAEYDKAKKTDAQVAEQYRTLYNYWTFLEKNIRQQLLAQKYQALLGACLISNPIEAQQAYADETMENSVNLVAFPYSKINDNKVEVTDADIKAKYDEMKARFRQIEETRDIKFVDLQVTASAADRAAIDKDIQELRDQLVTADDPTEIIRKSASLVPYLGVPLTRSAFPHDIAVRLDSLSAGSTSAPIENKEDNTLNVVKLYSKQQLADSIEYRLIQVAREDVAETRKAADSIYQALQAGADFEAIAKKYGQTGQKTWMTSREYESAPSMDVDTRKYINTLNTASVNALNNIEMTNGNVILQVTGRTGMNTKYVAAVIKKTIDFSKDTYNAAYNKFSQFVSESQSLEELEKNAAKYGYQIQDRQGVRNSEHYIAGIPATRDALKWVFEGKKGNVSPLYECGTNDHLLVVALNNVNPKGYLNYENNEDLKNYLKTEVLKDKKAEKILADVKDVKTLADARNKGGELIRVDQITFAAPVFVQQTGASEPALSGAVAGTKKGSFCPRPIKGNAGIYFVQVLDQQRRADSKYDVKKYEQQAQQKALQRAGNFMQELIMKANITDNRYLFF
ncbi:MAG: SurA N-terminal domain-containing protein [Prevotella sp.]|nr:SurA N-terminal domain-containing protein [Prevotella sp.]